MSLTFNSGFPDTYHSHLTLHIVFITADTNLLFQTLRHYQYSTA